MSLRHQCELLAIPRSSYYHQPQPIPPADLLLMRELVELFIHGRAHLEITQTRRALSPPWPCSKPRAHHPATQAHGHRDYLSTTPTTQPGPQPQRYPYLLRGLEIIRPDHVWCADITYVPMKTGAFYLFAIMDWATRYVTGWALSNTLDADYCIQCVKQVCGARPQRKPENFNRLR